MKKMKTFKSFLGTVCCLLVTLSTAQPDSGSGPPTQETPCVSGTKFIAVLRAGVFDQAKKFCGDNGGTLARISNKDENELVIGLLLRTEQREGERFWIGKHLESSLYRT